MAMRKLTYNVTVYKNTGFNGVDMPRNPAVLENAVKHTYSETYYVREDIDLPQISINDSYHNLADVDYVKLSTISGANAGEPTELYYIATPSPAAGNTTILSLELDGLMSMGGASNIDYISGWQERGHIAKSEDVLFGNIAPEDWSPSMPLKNSAFHNVNAGAGIVGATHPTADLQVILTNIDLVKLGQAVTQAGGVNNIIEAVKAGVIDSSTGDVDEVLCAFPKIEASPYSTIFTMYEPYTGSGYQGADSLQIPNTCAYDVTNPIVKNGLDLLFSCGQLQLQGSYTIPKEYVIETFGGSNVTDKTAEGRYIEISGSWSFETISDMPFEYEEDNFTAKNKKAYSLFRSFTLANIASGGAVTKPVHELKFENEDGPVVTVWSQTESTGKPSAKFVSDTTTDVLFVDTVNGTNWINNQLLMEGASGAIWNNINSSFSEQTINRNLELENYNYNVAVENYKDYVDTTTKTSLASLHTGGMNYLTNAGTTIAQGAEKGGTAGMTLGAIGTATSYIEQSYINNQNMLQQARENSRLILARKEANTAANAAAQQAINENKIGLLRSNGVIAPTVMFSPDPNLAMYGFNKFIVYETRLQVNDLKSLDDYFQRYGYNGIHRKLTRDCFTCRQYYTFVQAFDINIKAPSTRFGMRIRQKAIAQLNGGVRLWSVLPDARYYDEN